MASLWPLLVILTSQTDAPKLKSYDAPSRILQDGWQGVTSVPVWVRPRDLGSVLRIETTQTQVNVRYTGGRGQSYMDATTTPATLDDVHYEYRAMALYRDGSTRRLEARTANDKGQLKDLLAVFVQRRRSAKSFPRHPGTARPSASSRRVRS